MSIISALDIAATIATIACHTAWVFAKNSKPLTHQQAIVAMLAVGSAAVAMLLLTAWSAMGWYPNPNGALAKDGQFLQPADFVQANIDKFMTFSFLFISKIGLILALYLSLRLIALIIKWSDWATRGVYRDLISND